MPDDVQTILANSEGIRQLLDGRIYDLPERPKTYLDVAGLSRYESVWSNVYAYYFDSNEDHGGSLFLDCLIDLIREKKVKVPEGVFDDFSVSREEKTPNGMFIDLVLTETDNDQKALNVILIENKLSASLYNDLSEYLNSQDASNFKLGIVLAIRPYSKLPKGWISITHESLIDRIDHQPMYLFKKMSFRKFNFLREFLETIRSHYKTKAMQEAYQFCLEKGPEIEKVITLRNKVVLSWLEATATAMMPYPFKKGKYYIQHSYVDFKTEQHHYYLYFYYEKVLTERSILVKFWLRDRSQELWREIKTKEEIKNKFPQLNWNEETWGTNWLQLCSYQYEKLSIENLIGLEDWVTEEMDNTWMPVLEEAKKILGVDS